MWREDWRRMRAKVKWKRAIVISFQFESLCSFAYISRCNLEESIQEDIDNYLEIHILGWLCMNCILLKMSKSSTQHILSERFVHYYFNQCNQAINDEEGKGIMWSGEWTSWKWWRWERWTRSWIVNSELDENGEMESEHLEDWECQKGWMNCVM